MISNTTNICAATVNVNNVSEADQLPKKGVVKNLIAKFKKVSLSHNEMNLQPKSKGQRKIHAGGFLQLIRVNGKRLKNYIISNKSSHPALPEINMSNTVKENKPVFPAKPEKSQTISELVKPSGKTESLSEKISSPRSESGIEKKQQSSFPPKAESYLKLDALRKKTVDMRFELEEYAKKKNDYIKSDDNKNYYFEETMCRVIKDLDDMSDEIKQDKNLSARRTEVYKLCFSFFDRFDAMAKEKVSK
ncbi:hypothetical protein ABW286_18195 [Erwinia papayae]|uniref:BAG domain-containing protein n=1 Tax=Erwinia papayae TaxID=206499 RepID=A0ABV3N5J2_9GAMM